MGGKENGNEQKERLPWLAAGFCVNNLYGRFMVPVDIDQIFTE